MGLLRRKLAAQKRIPGQEGSIGDLLSVGICILAMATVMTYFMDCVRLVNRKTEMGQLARNYVLRMETVGYLTDADEELLRKELEAQGIQNVSLEGTTKVPVGYGARIRLRITGKVDGKYEVEETRVSTAKH